MKLNTDKSILDLDRLVEVYEDDHDGILELLGLMLKNNTGLLVKLETATAEHDLEGVRKAAHAMKGSTGNVGATQMYDLTRTLEERLRDGEWGGTPERVAEIHQAFLRLRREVESMSLE